MKKTLLLLNLVLALAAGASALADSDATVTVRIEGSVETIADVSVPIEECVITDNTGKEHELPATAACAIQAAVSKAGQEVEWKDYGFGIMIQRIGDDSTPDDWSYSWSFWVNDDMADVGADMYEPLDEDDILLAWSGYPAVPLRVTASEEIVGQFKVEKRVGETDENWVWHGSWVSAEGAMLHVGEGEYVVPEDGLVIVNDAREGDERVWAEGEGLVRSRVLVYARAENTPQPSLGPTVAPTVVPTPTVRPTPTPTLTVTPVVTVSQEQREEAAGKALAFLRQRQDDDGGVGGEMVTAWSVVAFGSDEISAYDVKRGENSLLEALGRSSWSSATDVERLILAVRATGANPRQFGGKDLVGELRQYAFNSQIGSEDLINDDVFGVLALLAANEPVESGWLEGVVRTVVEAQKSDGSWTGGLDMTAAAVQALGAYNRAGGEVEVSGSISKGVDYLLGHKDESGYGGNSATTSWVIQALLSAGEGVGVWDSLLEYQQVDGGFAWKKGEGSSELMTAYAVPALLGKYWPVVELSGVTDAEVSITAGVGQTVGSTVAPTVTVAPSIAREPEAVVNDSVVSAAVGGERDEMISASGLTHENQTQVVRAGTLAGTGKAQEQGFALAGLSLANLGIGVSLSRLISKLFI